MTDGPAFAPPPPPSRRARRSSCARQVFFAGGILLLVFELFVVPVMTVRWGIGVCQRLGSIVEVPIYFIIPLLSRMSSSKFLVPIAAVLLFVFLAGSDTVSGCCTCIVEPRRRPTI